MDGFAGCLADALSPSSAYLPADEEDEEANASAFGGGSGGGESPAAGDADADARAGLVLQLLLDGVQVGSSSCGLLRARSSPAKLRWQLMCVCKQAYPVAQ